MMESNRNPTQVETPEPQFGLIDVVESFTAMRHEFRNQTKEGRELASQLRAANETIAASQDRWTATMQQAIDVVGPSDSSARAVRIVAAVCELDQQMRRSIRAASDSIQLSVDRCERTTELSKVIDDEIASMGWLARRLCGTAMRRIKSAETVQTKSAAEFESRVQSTGDGLSMLLSRLDRGLDQIGIERIDVLGKPFDGTLMNAVDSIPTTQYAPGIVAEQISPAYQFDFKVIRYAEVRVARAGNESAG